MVVFHLYLIMNKGGQYIPLSLGIVKPLPYKASMQLLKDFERSGLKPYTKEQSDAAMKACEEVMKSRKKKANK